MNRNGGELTFTTASSSSQVVLETDQTWICDGVKMKKLPIWVLKRIAFEVSEYIRASYPQSLYISILRHMIAVVYCKWRSHQLSVIFYIG